APRGRRGGTEGARDGEAAGGLRRGDRAVVGGGQGASQRSAGEAVASEGPKVGTGGEVVEGGLGAGGGGRGRGGGLGGGGTKQKATSWSGSGSAMEPPARG
ncbi:hypothetical protein B1218_37650, partial [Pseudomonas ogarae]